MDQITALDYYLLPVYLFIIYKIAFYIRNVFYPPGHICRPYFIAGLSAKIAGSIFIGMIYNYYYGGGDSFNYFYHSRIINSTFSEHFDSWLRLITHSANTDNFTDAQSLSTMYWYDDIPAYTTSCLGALAGVFCFTKYLEINILIASVTFIGSWLMFITFVAQYKSLIKYISIAVLFMPGVSVWGSGLFKDSFCMFSISCLVYSFYILFEKRVFKISALLLIPISVVLLVLIKSYILVVLFPLLMLKTVLAYKKKVADRPTKKLAFYSLLSVLLIVCAFFFRKLNGYLSAFTMENVLQTVTVQKNYLLQHSIATDGSTYDLGDFEPTLNSISLKALPAINVTLFRPYLWESHSLIQIFNSLESTAILILTIYLILRKNIVKTIVKVYRDPNLIMCLIFTLIFAFFVGISSYNFGTLSRYKIPCTPFYMLFLMIIIFDKEPLVKLDSDQTNKPETNDVTDH